MGECVTELMQFSCLAVIPASFFSSRRPQTQRDWFRALPCGGLLTRVRFRV